MTRAYGFILRLYPREHRALFGEEMRNVLKQAAEEREPHTAERRRLAELCELGGLMAGMVQEWMTKLRRGLYLRQRCAAKILQASGEETAVRPNAELRDAERQVDRLVELMVYAIAHHDFPNARRLCAAEEAARANLRRLQRFS